MTRLKAILLASRQAPELQAIIQAGLHVEVDVPEDPRQMLHRLAERSYDLLAIDSAWLADGELSSLSGGEALAGLKRMAPQIEVLLLASPEERQQAVQQLYHGAADYILLPAPALELTVRVGRLLELQALRSAASQAAGPDVGTDQLAMLQAASREISQTLQLDESLAAILSRASQFTGADLTCVYLVDTAGNLSPGRWVSRLAGPEFGASIPDSLLGLAQQVALTQKLASYPDPVLFRDKTTSIQSALFLPMLSRDKLMGVLMVGSVQRAAFTAGHTHWLSVFCDQAAIAIENAYLFQNLSSAYIDLAQSREQILHSRNTLQVLFDGISDGLYILDQELTITALNQVEAERQGYQPAELIGKSCLSLDWARTEPELLGRIREALQTGQKTTWISRENETEPYLKDREFRIYPIRNRLAQIEQVVVFAQNVSERRRWQASLFRSANLAAVGQLAGSVAHQINNPLTVTMANSQLILQDVKPDSEIYDLATAIFKAGERIQNIVTNLLEFSNQETYVFVRADLVETIEAALTLVFRSLKKVGVEVVKDYQVRPIVSASVSHLKLVWMNLLLNARDAVKEHAVQPQVVISIRPVSEREVAVAITDNGVGIAEKDFEQLFRPFFTTKPLGQALGLGLYSAHAIVERHRGQIRVSSQPGQATTFEVILPLDNPHDL